MPQPAGNFRLVTRSDFDGLVWAVLLRHLELGPTVIAGGSGGSRVSLLTAARNPDVTAGHVSDRPELPAPWTTTSSTPKRRHRHGWCGDTTAGMTPSRASGTR